MKLKICLSIIAIFFAFTGLAQSSHYNLEDGLAIEGYDLVAYQTQSKAIEGKSQYKTVYKGVSYYFTSSSNKNLFNADPEKYLPAYGGWCAYAMGAKGEKVSVDPETFKVLQGKLYLFYNSWGNNTLPKWNRDESNLKQKADRNWSATMNQ